MEHDGAVARRDGSAGGGPFAAHTSTTTTISSGSRFSGWSVLSPVFVTETSPQVSKLSDGRYLVWTQTLSLLVSPDCGPEPLENAEIILRWLRLVTGHAALAAPVIAGHSPIRVVRGRLPEGGLEGRPVNDVEKNTILFERMTSAARLHPSCEVPTYTEILQDAIEAHALEDCERRYSTLRLLSKRWQRRASRKSSRSRRQNLPDDFESSSVVAPTTRRPC